MINLRLALKLPFLTNGISKNYFVWCKKLSKNKAFEIQVARSCGWNWLELFLFCFQWSMREDHAGVNIEIGLFNYWASAQIYDNRHWNHENNCWEKYDVKDAV